MSEDKKEQEQEQEKEIKIDLKTLVILIMLVIIIFIIFMVMYNNGEKTISTLPDNNITQGVNNKSVEFKEDDAIELLKKYLDEKSIAYASPQALLEKYGFATNKQFEAYSKTADTTFIKTDIMYEDIMKKMQEYITKDLFTKEFKTIYKSSNGVTHVANLNNPKQTYNITRHEIVENKNKPVIQVWYTTTQSGQTSEEKSMKVEFTQILGKWIISNIS